MAQNEDREQNEDKDADNFLNLSSEEGEKAKTSSQNMQDPFADLDRYSIKEDILSGPVSDAPILIGHPDPQTFFQIHPTIFLASPVLRYKPKNVKNVEEWYWVDKSLQEQLLKELTPCLLVPFITHPDYNIGMWAISKKNEGKYLESCKTAVEEAKKKWIRIIWNGSLNVYDRRPATTLKTAPKWPSDFSRDTFIRRAFGSQVVTSMTDQIVLKLHGDASIEEQSGEE